MNQYRIHTPVPGHTEVIGTVAFAQGVATVEAEPTAAPLMYFRAQGYTIEELDADGNWVPETPPERQRAAVDQLAELAAENAALRAELAAPRGEPGADRPARNASTEVWRAWAVDHGGLAADEVAELTRDQLVELFADQRSNS